MFLRLIEIFISSIVFRIFYVIFSEFLGLKWKKCFPHFLYWKKDGENNLSTLTDFPHLIIEKSKHIFWDLLDYLVNLSSFLFYGAFTIYFYFGKKKQRYNLTHCHSCLSCFFELYLFIFSFLLFCRYWRIWPG